MKVKELAQILQLSPSTVSLVLNNKPGISEATRIKVIDKVKELGYSDMLPTASLGRAILFLVYRKKVEAEFSQRFSQLFSEMIEGVESQAKKSGYKVVVTYVNDANLTQEAENIRQAQYSGIILLATELGDDALKVFSNIDIPIVLLDKQTDLRHMSGVTIQNEQGVYEAISYLKKNGHTHIGYMHIIHNATNFEDRYYGFLRAMDREKLTIYKEYCITLDTLGGDEVADKLSEALSKLKNMPTAFFADNDILAVYAVQSLQKMGYDIPGDVSVIGFDNMNIGELLLPNLTTVKVNKREMGRCSFRLLLDKINDRTIGDVRIQIPTEIVERHSVRTIERSDSVDKGLF